MPILYSVTVMLPEAMAAEWAAWMRTVHIPEVMATGCFMEARFTRLLQPVEDPAMQTFNTQYSCATMADYERYRDLFAPALQQKTRERYGEQLMAFRTLLEQLPL